MTQTQEILFTRLNRLGTGERAALKRQAGILLKNADGKAIAAFYKCLPAVVDGRAEGKWFATACLRCMWAPGEESDTPLERILSQLIAREQLSDSVRHRVETLIDTPWDGDGYLLTKLSRLVKLVRQKSEETPDFGSLLTDLEGWNGETQWVQRKWARAIFSNTKEPMEDTEKGENDHAD